MSNREVLRDKPLPGQLAADSYCSKHAKFHLVSVRVPWHAGVTQSDGQTVSLSISEHKSLVGNLAVASKPFKGDPRAIGLLYYVMARAEPNRASGRGGDCFER